jgi:hypothetical protein
MKKTVIGWVICYSTWVFIMQSCKNSSQAGHTGIPLTSDTARFYPVNDYLRLQIKKVDSAAQLIYRLTVENGKTDSVVLSTQQFDSLANTFLQYDISDKNNHKYYHENVFMDETTGSYTFNYTSLNNGLPLQSVDILLDTIDNHVKRVFITRAANTGTLPVTEKMGWKNDNSFYINRITENGSNTNLQQNTVVWHYRP